MADEDDKPACKYGINCYRRNEEHKERFSHPPKDRNDTDREQSKSPPKHVDLNTTPPAKRRKTVSSDGSDDSDSDAEDQPEIESISNGSEKSADASMAKVEDEDEEEEEPHQSSPAQKDKAATERSAATPTRCSEFISKNFDKGPHGQRVEHQNLLESPALFIRSKFLVEMPADFYEFWSFCEANTKADSKPENLLSKFGLSLVGPFDVLAKKFDKVDPFEPGEYLRHWRFYYDPPEFQVSEQCCHLFKILFFVHTIEALFD